MGSVAVLASFLAMGLSATELTRAYVKCNRDFTGGLVT